MKPMSPMSLLNSPSTNMNRRGDSDRANTATTTASSTERKNSYSSVESTLAPETRRGSIERGANRTLTRQGRRKDLAFPEASSNRNRSSSEPRGKLWSLFSRGPSPPDPDEVKPPVFVKPAPKLIKKMQKLFSMQEKEFERKTVFLAKFRPNAKDNISLALLAASDFYAALMLVVCRSIPGVILILLLLVVSAETGLPGIMLLQNASELEQAVIVLSIGLLVTVNLLGPLSRPFATLPNIYRMLNILPPGGDIRLRLIVVSTMMVLKHMTAVFVIIASPLVSILSAARVVNLVWASLALLWIESLENILAHEIIHKFYRHSTVLLAITDLRWVDTDTKKQFWRTSWTSKSEIRERLVDTQVPSEDKWTLLTNKNRGLGLGSSKDGVPIEANMELIVIQWAALSEEQIKNLGPVAAHSLDKNEWTYHLSRIQRRLFFKYYPLQASKMPWSGFVVLGDIGFTVAHTASVLKIISQNTIEELFLNGNKIDDDGAALIAATVQNSTSLRKLWLYNNCIGEEGGVALGRALKVNTSLVSLQLRENKLGNESAKEMAEALKSHNKTLTVLGVDNNLIRNKGAISLLTSLSVNPNLSRVWIAGNKFGHRKLEELIKARGMQTRMIINSEILPPVTRHLVRTRLEDMNLNPRTRKHAKLQLKKWSKMVGKYPKRGPADNFAERMDSLVDIDVKRDEVMRFVDVVTAKLVAAAEAAMEEEDEDPVSLEKREAQNRGQESSVRAGSILTVVPDGVQMYLEGKGADLPFLDRKETNHVAEAQILDIKQKDEMQATVESEDNKSKSTVNEIKAQASEGKDIKTPNKSE